MTAAVVDAGDALPLTVPALVRERAGRGDHRLLVCDDLELSYAEAQRRSAALAKGLLALGAGPGTRVGLLYPNGPDFVVAALAGPGFASSVPPKLRCRKVGRIRGLGQEDSPTQRPGRSR